MNQEAFKSSKEEDTIETENGEATNGNQTRKSTRNRRLPNC